MDTVSNTAAAADVRDDLTATSPADAGLDQGALGRLRESVESDVRRGLHYGAAVLVARGGVVGFHEAIGTTQGENSRPVRLDDRFLMMSLTKSFTAAAVLRLVDRGELSFDTPIASVIPEFAVRGKERITVYQLLTHSAGLYYGFDLPPALRPFGSGILSAAVGAVTPLPVHSRPGSRVSYSPWEGFAVLGEMLRRLDPADRGFRRILREDVFLPLGMNDTTIGADVDDPRRVPLKVVAPGEAAQPASELELMNDQGADCEMPGVSGYSTTADLFRFAEMTRRGGRGLDGARLLSPAIVDYAYRVHTGTHRNHFWDFYAEAEHLPDFPANFTLGGGYGRGSGDLHITPMGYTASERAYAGVGGGTTMFMVDPLRDFCFVFLSSGMVEGLAHFQRLRRLADLALAAVED